MRLNKLYQLMSIGFLSCSFAMAARGIYEGSLSTSTTTDSDWRSVTSSVMDRLESISEEPVEPYTIFYSGDLPCIRALPGEEAPQYFPLSGAHEAGPIHVTSGSVLNYSSKGAVGCCIRGFSGCNKVPNPYGITHSGCLHIVQPHWIYSDLREKLDTNRLERAEAERMSRYGHAEPDAFSLISAEADGTAGEVIRFRKYPYVHIYPFSDRLRSYDGGIRLRLLYDAIPYHDSIRILSAAAYKPYEGFRGILRMAAAAFGRQTVRDVEKLFCSEFVVHDLQEAGRVNPLLNPGDFIPEQLSFGAGEAHDLLRGIAGPDIVLKAGPMDVGEIVVAE